MSYLNEHNLTRNDKFRCICRWNESIERISCAKKKKKKIFNYLIHTHILVVIIIISQRMTFLSWEFRCCEKEKNNRSIIFDMLVLSQIYWFFFLLPFYSFPTKLFDIFIDKQSFLRIGMGSSIGRVLFSGGGCAVRSYIHESRMRKERREADHSCKDEI